MDWVTTTIMAVQAIGNAIMTPITKAKSYAAQRAQLDAEIAQIDKNIGYLKEDYANEKNQLNASASQSIRNLNYNIDWTGARRDQNANSASISNVKSQQMAYEDLSMTLANASQSEGSAVQSSSLTGFRNSGSNENVVKEVQRQNDYAVQRAKDKAEMSAFQSFNSAYTDYFSATKQIESYQQNIADTNENLKLALEGLRIDFERNLSGYEYNKALAQQKRKEAEYSGWDAFLDVVTLGLQGANDVYSEYKSAQRNELTNDLQSAQLKYYESMTI